MATKHKYNYAPEFPPVITVREYLEQAENRFRLLSTFDATGPNPINWVRTNAGFGKTAVRRAMKRLGIPVRPLRRKGVKG